MKWCILAESDNESAPTQSPVKTSRSVKVKTLEEIRLEKIQAESAAYYSYPGKILFFLRIIIKRLKKLLVLGCSESNFVFFNKNFESKLPNVKR